MNGSETISPSRIDPIHLHSTEEEVRTYLIARFKKLVSIGSSNEYEQSIDELLARGRKISQWRHELYVALHSYSVQERGSIDAASIRTVIADCLDRGISLPRTVQRPDEQSLESIRTNYYNWVRRQHPLLDPMRVYSRTHFSLSVLYKRFETAAAIFAISDAKLRKSILIKLRLNGE